MDGKQDEGEYVIVAVTSTGNNGKTRIRAYGKIDSSALRLDLSKAEAVAIVNVLLPKVDPTKKVSEYKTMGKCVDWLMSLAGGTTWETEMEALRNEHCAAALMAQPRLF